MSLNSNLERMKREALEMGAYYYKGFGNTINGILANSEVYLLYSDKDKVYLEKSYKWLGELEKHYQDIPFDDLHGRDKFYPLFIVRDLLPKFKFALDGIKYQEPEIAMEDLNRESITIVNVGRLYGDSFQELTKKIRSYTESSNFYVKITDYQNNTFYF